MPGLRRSATLVALATFVSQLALSSEPALAGEDCDPASYLGDPYTITTGNGPLFSAVADFNEDGRMDLAVCNSAHAGGPSSLAILLGTAGGLGGPTLYALGTGPWGILAADFDEDGITDLLTTNYAAQQISFHRGQGLGGVGDGTFSAHVAFPVGGNAFQPVAGDYNEDGILDVAVAINNIARVTVLLGQGAGGVWNGSFAAPVHYPLANRSTGITQGDFNSDGILDLVATENFSGTVGVLRGQGAGGVGDGTFASAMHFAAGPEPFDVEVFDYDADGIQDLAVASASSGGTRVLHGLGAGGVGNGTFTIQTTLPTGNSGSVAIGDVNEDGLLDLVSDEVVVPVGRRVHTYLGQGTAPVGNGSWIAAGAPITLADEPYHLEFGDFRGNGHQDLAITSYLVDRITVLEWDCRVTGPVPPDPRRPVLTRVRDVPADEGGRVYLTWLPSSLDFSGGTATSYRVWREIPEEAVRTMEPAVRASTLALSSAGAGGTTLVTFWEAIATLPAERLQGYGYTAATTEDSTASNPHSTAFFVSVLTPDVNVTFASDVVRGASIDNTPPEAPADFRLESGAPGTVVLAWSANGEPDLDGYRLERSAAPAFPAEATVVTSIEPTATVHVEAMPGGATFYRIAAVDEHENLGEYAPMVAVGAVSTGETPAVFAFAGAFPNPSHGSGVTLHFSLAGQGKAGLELFDVRGRRVAAPALDGRGAGPQTLRLDGTVRLAAGVYVARLSEAGRVLERKFTIAP